MKRHWHLETKTGDIEFFKLLIAYGKKKRLFKDYLGSHVHITEAVSYESNHGDLKRAEKFFLKSMNYNASLTASDVDGFNCLDESIRVTANGKVLATLTGRECLLSFYKMEDGSPLFAEVHQVSGSSSVQLVYPNCKEAEAAVNAMTKHSAAYTMFTFRENGIDEEFIMNFLTKFFEPPFVHSASDCRWDSKDKVLLTPEDQEDDGIELEHQSWFIDIVEKHEERKSNSGRGYAEKKAMFNLDGENSLKTMHERNDGVTEEVIEIDDSEGENVIDLNSEVEDEIMKDVDSLQEEADGEKDTPVGQQSGHTPGSGSVRFSVRRDDDEASASSDESSAIVENPMNNQGTASDAGQSHTSPETGVSG